MKYTKAMNWRIWIGAASVLALALFGACDGNGDGGEESSKSISDQVGSESEDKDKDEEAGGTEEIDHGGITSIPDDPDLIEKGEKLFGKKGCKACHKIEEKLTGPALAGVAERREPEWIARMILHPEKMLEVDPTARELLGEFNTPMPNQNVTPEEAKALMAYLGSSESAEAGKSEAAESAE